MFRKLLTTLTLVLLSSSAYSIEKPTLTVYSYGSFLSEWGPGEKIKNAFEAECGCELNIINVGDGVAILNRLRLEGDKTKADVVIGLDTNLVDTAKKAKLFQPHQIVQPTNLAVDWWDNEFIPYDHGYFAFIYNAQKIANPPHNFEQLINNPYDWKIVYPDPRTSTPGLGLVLWMNKVYSDNTTNAWQSLAKHTLTVTKGWSAAYSLFLKGEADFVLSYSSSPVVHIQNDKDYSFKTAIFDEGHYQQIEIAGMSSYTKQPELAKRFLNFLLTPKIQSYFVEKNVMYPVIDIELPKAYNEINHIEHGLSFDAETINQNQKRWINQWQQAVSQ
ncbi:thiamine ABC transporter substrate binding subunit [Orbaceae bacterium ac157xtp]